MRQSTSNELAESLAANGLTITAEIVPPASANAGDLTGMALGLRGVVDAVNVTDGPMAKVHMSAVASSGILKQNGIEPILQMTCRDRNRIAILSDLLGAAALGVQNILALSGDGVEAGDYSDAKAVFDAGSLDIIRWAAEMSSEGLLPQGVPKEGSDGTPPPRTKLKTAADFFIGAADVPTVPTTGWQPKGLIEKIEAGAKFVQTQLCYDIDIAKQYLTGLADHGVPERAAILIGTGPLASARQARYIDENLWGVSVPDDIVRRLEKAKDAKAEGVAICAEFVCELAQVPGVAGAHVMAPGNGSSIRPAVEAYRNAA